MQDQIQDTAETEVTEAEATTQESKEPVKDERGFVQINPAVTDEFNKKIHVEIQNTVGLIQMVMNIEDEHGETATEEDVDVVERGVKLLSDMYDSLTAQLEDETSETTAADQVSLLRTRRVWSVFAIAMGGWIRPEAFLMDMMVASVINQINASENALKEEKAKAELGEVVETMADEAVSDLMNGSQEKH